MDRRSGMGEHAEGVPLAAGEHHLRVRERSAATSDLRARHHDGAAVADAGFLFLDERHRLLCRRRLRSEQCGCQVLQRDPLGTVDNGRGQILVAQTNDPLRELPAERLRPLAAGRRAPLLEPGADRKGRTPMPAAMPAVANVDSRRKRRRSLRELRMVMIQHRLARRVETLRTVLPWISTAGSVSSSRQVDSIIATHPTALRVEVVFTLGAEL
jgi:hypothetical protein